MSCLLWHGNCRKAEREVCSILYLWLTQNTTVCRTLSWYVFFVFSCRFIDLMFCFPYFILLDAAIVRGSGFITITRGHHLVKFESGHTWWKVVEQAHVQQVNRVCRVLGYGYRTDPTRSLAELFIPAFSTSSPSLSILLTDLPWIWRQQIPAKYFYRLPNYHSVTVHD